MKSIRQRARELYGFTPMARKWVKSIMYLKSRKIYMSDYPVKRREPVYLGTDFTQSKEI